MKQSKTASSLTLSSMLGPHEAFVKPSGPNSNQHINVSVGITVHLWWGCILTIISKDAGIHFIWLWVHQLNCDAAMTLSIDLSYYNKGFKSSWGQPRHASKTAPRLENTTVYFCAEHKLYPCDKSLSSWVSTVQLTCTWEVVQSCCLITAAGYIIFQHHQLC